MLTVEEAIALVSDRYAKFTDPGWKPSSLNTTENFKFSHLRYGGGFLIPERITSLKVRNTQLEREALISQLLLTLTNISITQNSCVSTKNPEFSMRTRGVLWSCGELNSGPIKQNLRLLRVQSVNRCFWPQRSHRQVADKPSLLNVHRRPQTSR